MEKTEKKRGMQWIGGAYKERETASRAQLVRGEISTSIKKGDSGIFWGGTQK